jgi:hypothetical protein
MNPYRAIRSWWVRVTDPPPGWDDSLEDLERLKAEVQASLRRNQRIRRVGRRRLSKSGEVEC